MTVPCARSEMAPHGGHVATAHGGHVARAGLFLPDTSQWQLSDFSFKQVIGQGSYGKVRLCVHKPTNEIYAVKCLRKADNLRPHKVSKLHAPPRGALEGGEPPPPCPGPNAEPNADTAT